MGKRVDLINSIFSNWKVLDYDFEKEIENKRLNKRHRAYWVCQCKCGKIKSVLGESLKNGRSKSCGCSGKTAFKDLTGKDFYDLHVLRRDMGKEHIERSNKGKSRTYWLCQCRCGNIISVDSEVLRTKRQKHCGCKKFIDLSGRTFGYLSVLYRDFDLEKERKMNGSKNHAVYWKCECICGTKKSVKYSHLVSGGIKSCGCIVSYGEKQIKEILNKYEIKFKNNTTLKNAKSFKGGDLKFDFILESLENRLYVIEFDGEQHFGYTGRDWSTKEHFDMTRKNDILKDKYCFDNNIPIIRIPYVMLHFMTIDDLRLETSNFILTRENEEEYYQKYAEIAEKELS